MRKLIHFALVAASLLMALPTFATTYYIDYVAGSDANNGTSKSTPWQHAPGMAGCVNSCAATIPQPGDNFILKGGVTWPNVAFMWTWSHSGTSGNNINIGVDQTWFTGASWSRPVFDAGGMRITGGGSNWNDFITVQASNVTFDNIEFKGHLCDTYAWPQNAVIEATTGSNVLMQDLYYHGWTSGGTQNNTCQFVLATSHYPLDFAGNVLEYSVMDGSDTIEVLADPNCTGSCNGVGNGIYGGVEHVRYNIFRYVTNGFVGQTDDFHDNVIEYLRRSPYPNDHGNGFENNIACNALIYNNIIRHTYFVESRGAGSHNGVTFWNAIFPGHDCVSYMFNNLIYDTTPGNVMDIAHAVQASSAGWSCALSGQYCANAGTVILWNNTVECGDDSGVDGGTTQVCGGCDSTFEGCTWQNNHFITSNTTPLDISGNPPGTRSNNLTQIKAQANAQGYTMSNLFAPASGGSTIGFGANLTSDCGSLPALCNETTLATLFGANHISLPPGRTTNARPSGGAWDAGAYQYSSSTVTKPQPPTNLKAVVQ